MRFKYKTRNSQTKLFALINPKQQFNSSLNLKLFTNYLLKKNFLHPTDYLTKIGFVVTISQRANITFSTLVTEKNRSITQNTSLVLKIYDYLIIISGRICQMLTTVLFTFRKIILNSKYGCQL
jgi:hypothetical protein